MNYRPDKHGNNLSILGFGCMRFPRRGGRIDMAASEAMFVSAVERGVNYFDTAYIYPGSEEAVGHIVAKNNLRKKINIATKLPLFMVKTYADFDKFFNASLKRLKTDYIDYYLMHMITTPEQWRSLCDLGIEGWIEEKRAAGQIRQLGFSFHGKREDFVSIVDAREWDFCMIQYNYLDINNQAGRSGLKHAVSKNIPVMVMEPLLGGRLADPKMLPEGVLGVMSKSKDLKSNSLYEDGGYPRNAPPKTDYPKTHILKPLRGQKSPSGDFLTLTPAARALRWVWDHEEVTLLLSGMSSQSQVDENIEIAEGMTSSNILDKEELDVIDKAIRIFDGLKKIPCTGCGYCAPCPFGVNIPGCFNAYNLSFTIKYFKALMRYIHETAALASAKGMAGACTACGKCEAHCPQGIRIRDELNSVRRRLEPFWFTAGISAVRFFMSH